MSKTIFLFFRTLAMLRVGELWRLLVFGARHPWLSVLGMYATVQAYVFSSKNYPTTQHKNGKANALRHALWTAYIALYASKISSAKKAVDFAVLATKLHEEIFPNTALQKSMDLHNNMVGAKIFLDIVEGVHRQFVEKSFLVEAISLQLKNAILLSNEQEILSVKNTTQLVYIERLAEEMSM